MRGMRKFLSSITAVVLLGMLPIIFKLMGISEGLALASLGGIASVSSLYLGANVLRKKKDE